MTDETRPLRHYGLFGLRLETRFALPELAAATAGPPDVSIRFDDPIEEFAESSFARTPDGGRLAVDGVAVFTIEKGRTIIVQPVAGVPERNVRLFLLGSAMGVLLHQRGIFPLHANAVEVDGKAIAFFGESGAGKSTLAGWFHDHGHRVLADDVCAIRFADDGSPVALPGIPRLRLWRDALLAGGRTPDGLERSFTTDEPFDKYDLPLPGVEVDPAGLPLAGAYLLTRGPRLLFRPLSGTDAAEALFAHTYRGAFVGDQSGRKEHWSNVVRLIGKLPLFAVERRWDLSALGADAQALLAHARAIVDPRG